MNKAKVTAMPFRMHELNLFSTGGWLLVPCETMSRALWRILNNEGPHRGGIGLPFFMCWLNYYCVR